MDYRKKIVGRVDTGGAAPHRRECRGIGQGPRKNADQKEQYGPDPQDEKDIEAQKRQQKHHEIRKRQRDLVFIVPHGSTSAPNGVDHEDQQRQERRRKRDPEIDPELVPHLDPLGLGGSDRRIGNKGEIVPEHGAAHDGPGAQGQ